MRPNGDRIARFSFRRWVSFRRWGAAACLALGLLTTAPALAQPAPAADGFVASSLRIAADAWDGLVSGAGRVWDAAAAMFLPAAPASYLPDQWSEADREFLSLMDAAGYRLASLQTGGMILTHVTYRFAQERRLTDGDRERARRAVALYRSRHWGVTAYLNRWVVEAVLDAGLAPGYRVATIDVTMLPLPSLSFQAVALDRPLDDSERRLLRELRPGAESSAR